MALSTLHNLLIGFPLYIMLGYFTFVAIYYILAVTNCIFRSKYLGKVVNKINSYLFWNGFIRLFMELYQGLAVATVLNIHSSEGNENSPFLWVKVSYWFAFAGLILIVALPILLFLPFYCLKRKEWSTEAFQGKYGALLEGTRT